MPDSKSWEKAVMEILLFTRYLQAQDFSSELRKYQNELNIKIQGKSSPVMLFQYNLRSAITMI
jgi:hypothetical protein